MSRVFVLKLRSIRGDGTRQLRWILKTLLRQYGFRCVSAHEERGNE